MQRSPEEAEKTPSPGKVDGEGKPEEKKVGKKFHNGWTKQLEQLVAEWADKSSCYQWMHQKTESIFSRLNMYYTIPVIILSTLTGTANFATDAIVTGPDMKKYITFGIGAISIITGIISTVANFLRYAQGTEAHRVAGISWGKFQRFISIELALHPNERMDAMSFLKMGRIELDRLIEQSPPIPVKVIQAFMVAFEDKPDIKRPEIAGGIEHTRIFDDSNARLAKVAADAAFMIQQKKGLIRSLVLEDIDKQIVKRTREEREAMEETLRQEILTTAKGTAKETAEEAALRIVKATPVTQYTKGLTFKNAREEVQKVVPNGIIEKTKEKLGAKLPSPGRLAAEAAAAAAAFGHKEGPSSVYLEIVEEPSGQSKETNE
jgi:hypothetical protein